MRTRSISVAERLARASRLMKQNQRLATLTGGALIALVVVAFLRSYYIGTQEKNAQADMYQAVYYFESDSLVRALEGDGIHYGLIDVMDAYQGTPSANLAHFYAGVCYLKMGNHAEAIDYLSDFDGDDLLLQARAYSLIGDAYTELEDYRQAARYYVRAAHDEANELFSPTYLEKAASAWEAANEIQKAVVCYEEIEQKYPKSRAYDEAVKHIARLGVVALLPETEVPADTLAIDQDEASADDDLPQ